MLVLAMEFSRGAERTQGAGPPNFQTSGPAPFVRAIGRRPRGRPASQLRDGIRPGLSEWTGSRGHSLKTEQ